MTRSLRTTSFLPTTSFLLTLAFLLTIVGVASITLAAPAHAQDPDPTPVGLDCGGGTVASLRLGATPAEGVDSDVSFQWDLSGDVLFTPDVSQAFPADGDILGSDLMGTVDGTLLVSLREWPSPTLDMYESLSQAESLATEYGVDGLDGASRTPSGAVASAPDPIRLPVTTQFNLEEAYLALVNGQPAPQGSGSISLFPGSGSLNADAWEPAYGEYGAVVLGLDLDVPGLAGCEVLPSDGGTGDDGTGAGEELAAWFAVIPVQEDLLTVIQEAAAARDEAEEAEAVTNTVRALIGIGITILVLTAVGIGWRLLSRRRRAQG